MHRRFDLPLLALAIAAAGVASIRLGQDANWDLLNYHLYNPWAWITGRYGFDIAPAQLQTFHNPLLDMPFWLMVDAGWRPRVIAFALAVPAGIALWFVYRIAALLFAGLGAPLAATATVAAVAVGATGPNARSMLCTTMNEWQVAALLTPALYVIVRDLVAGQLRSRTLVVAGLLAGAASGLKLTAAGYALAVAGALLAARGPRRGFPEASVYSLAVLVGLAVTLGPWMAQLYALTGNPLFPYFNRVFESPLLPPDWTFLKAFGPRTLGQWLALPFDLLRPPQGYVSEQRYRDARFPVVAALALGMLLLPVVRRAAGRLPLPSAFDGRPGERDALRFGAAFFVASFALWAWLHAIHRYLLLLEVLAGVAIVAMLVVLVPARARVAAVVALCLAVVVTTRVPTWWRVPYGKRFVTVEAPPIGPGALVLAVGGPHAFLLAAFPPDARFVGVGTNLVTATPSGLKQSIRDVVAAHPGEMHALVVRGEDPAKVLNDYGLVAGTACRPVNNNLTTWNVDLCPVTRR